MKSYLAVLRLWTNCSCCHALAVCISWMQEAMVQFSGRIRTQSTPILLYCFLGLLQHVAQNYMVSSSWGHRYLVHDSHGSEMQALAQADCNSRWGLRWQLNSLTWKRSWVFHILFLKCCHDCIVTYSLASDTSYIWPEIESWSGHFSLLTISEHCLL